MKKSHHENKNVTTLQQTAHLRLHEIASNITQVRKIKANSCIGSFPIFPILTIWGKTTSRLMVQWLDLARHNDFIFG